MYRRHRWWFAFISRTISVSISLTTAPSSLQSCSRCSCSTGTETKSYSKWARRYFYKKKIWIILLRLRVLPFLKQSGIANGTKQMRQRREPCWWWWWGLRSLWPLTLALFTRCRMPPLLLYEHLLVIMHVIIGLLQILKTTISCITVFQKVYNRNH